MPNGVSNVSLTAPTDPALELADVARKRKLAEALQAQAMQTNDGGTQVVGGWAIPNSPLQGIAKMAQSLSGSYQNKQLDQREKDIAATARKQDLAERNQIIATLTNPGQPVVADPNAAQPPQWLANAQSSTMNDGSPAGAPTAPNARPLSPQMRMAAELAKSSNPAYGQMGLNALMTALSKDKDESLFSKIDPKDYSSASVAKFSQSHNFADLVPVRKKELANLGGTSRLYDPYADATGDMGHVIKPDTTATLNQAQQHWSNLSANQGQSLAIDRARLANQGIETGFNTGSGVTAPIGAPPMPQAGAPVPAGAPAMPPQGAMPPQPAPQAAGALPAPVMAPAAQAPRVAAPAMAAAPADGLTPAARVQVSKDRLMKKQDMEVKREFNMGGIGDTIAEARKILTGQGGALPTSSGVGSLVDSAAGFVGIAPKGSPQADQLRALGGALTSKVPRMEGPQSDKDVQLYREMAGQVGDSSLPLARRVAALDTVEKLYAKYEHLNQGVGVPDAAPLGNITERRTAPRSGSSRIVVDY